MIDSNNTSTWNTRKIVGPSVEIVRDTDDIINVDTTAGPVTLTLQNISSSGALQTTRKVFINDIGNQVSVNPITILGAGGDLVNSGGSVIINVNGANAACTVANLTEWAVTGVGVVSAGIGGGGTTNRIAKFTTPTTIGDSLLFDNGVSVGLGTIAPHASAVFDITSTTQGLLYPRMTTVQRDAIVTPATSLIIYNVTTSRFEYYTGAAWTSMDMNGIYGGAGTVPTSTVATVTDFLRFVSVSGGVTTEFGIGADPLGFGNSGVVNYLFNTPATNLEAWGGIMTVSGEPAWWNEVYNAAGDTSGFFTGYSVAQANSYSSIYHFQAATGLYTGFEANASGEQLYSQRLALVTTALTVNDRVLFASAAGGYIKTTTYADLVAQLGVTTLYTGDGSTPGARTVTLGGTLQFNHGAAAANGYFQLVSGGYVYNQTVNPGQFFEYNHNTAILNLQADAASTTGYRATNTGGVNPTALVEMFAGSNSTAYFNIGSTTDRLDFYVNNTAKYAGGIIGGSGAYNGSWGFGTQPTTAAKVHIIGENGQGAGTIIQSLNLSPAEAIIQIRDAANVTKLQVSAVGVTTISDRAYIGYNLGSVVTGAAFAAKGSDSSFLSTQIELFDGSNNSLWKMMNNGNVGHNIAPNALDRLYIRAGASYDGAINISSSNLANNGYSILAQGGTGGANYNGIWSDANGGGTGIVMSFRGSSGSTGSTHNYGASFSARNGSTASIAVYADANGGDAVNASQGITGLWANVGGNASTVRRASYYTVSQAGGVEAGLTYGSKIEAGYVSTLAAESLWGMHITMSGSGAGLSQYALTTSGANVGFGTHTPSNQALVELVSTNQAFLIMRMTAAQASAITPANGMMLYATDTDATFIVVGFWGYENGVWTKL